MGRPGQSSFPENAASIRTPLGTGKRYVLCRFSSAMLVNLLFSLSRNLAVCPATLASGFLGSPACASCVCEKNIGGSRARIEYQLNFCLHRFSSAFKRSRFDERSLFSGTLSCLGL